MGEAAEVTFEDINLGIGSLTAGAFHHHAAKNSQNENDEGEIESPGTLFVEDEVDDGGPYNENVRYDFVYSKISLIVHNANIAKLNNTFC